MVLLSIRKLFGAVGLWLVLAGLSVRLAKADTIFSNFGPGMTYDTTVGHSWLVSGSGVLSSQVVANEFTATGDFTFTDAQLALSLNSGTNSVSVYLETNDPVLNLPDTIIEGPINLAGLAPAPVGSVLVANSALNPILTAGTSYWLVAAALNADTHANWRWNSTGDLSSASNFAHNQVASPTGPWGLDPSGETRGAFEIDGAPVPEPGTLLLLGSGLIALGAKARRRLLPK